MKGLASSGLSTPPGAIWASTPAAAHVGQEVGELGGKSRLAFASRLSRLLQGNASPGHPAPIRRPFETLLGPPVASRPGGPPPRPPHPPAASAPGRNAPLPG